MVKSLYYQSVHGSIITVNNFNIANYTALVKSVYK